MKSSKNILVCYNEPKSIYENYLGKDPDGLLYTDLSEKGLEDQIDSIIQKLSESYTNVKRFAVNGSPFSLFKEIRSYNPDTIFNLTESVDGNAQMESHIAAMFDILEVSYTGNSSLALGNCLFKQQAKRILIGSGITTPNYEVIKYHSNNYTVSTDLKFPLIVKLLREDASIGISELSIVNSKKELMNRVKYLLSNFKQDLLLEEYIEGRELNVSILDNKVLPISEIDFKGLPKELPKIITYEAKWSPESDYYKFTNPVCPATLPKRIANKISAVALKAFKELDCRDYARVDIRLSKDNVPYVIEINPNPDISPDSGFARSAAAAGIGYDELINKLIELSIGRYY